MTGNGIKITKSSETGAVGVKNNLLRGQFESFRPGKQDREASEKGYFGASFQKMVSKD